MTILAFDIGNSLTSIGIFRGEAMLAHWKTTTDGRWRSRAWREIVSLCRAEAGIETVGLSGCAISSVVPGATAEVVRAVRSAAKLRPLIIRGSTPGGVRTRYLNPDSLGPDRYCAATAAWRKYRGPLVVVDCGTAITFDPVTRSGIHPGGLIAPGLTISAKSLGAGTAALPSVEWSVPEEFPARETSGAIRSGVLHGTAGGIRDTVDRLKKILGGRATIVGTGGDAPVLQELFGLFDRVDPHLVLEGACAIYRNTRRRRSRGGA